MTDNLEIHDGSLDRHFAGQRVSIGIDFSEQPWSLESITIPVILTYMEDDAKVKDLCLNIVSMSGEVPQL